MSTKLDISHRPATESQSGPVNLSGLSLVKLRQRMEDIGVEKKKVKMRANQIWRWMHHYGVMDFDEMTDVAKDMRAKLAEDHILERPEIIDNQVSVDGTQKWLTRYGPNIEAESVFIPDVGKAGRSFY